MDMGRLLTNASLLIIAGSETTATSLSGVTYLLLKNPECMRKLTEEVRSTFRTEDEITMTSVGILPYMLACLNEGLRRYPPASFGLPRVTPKGGARIAGVFVPEDTAVSVWQWAAYHSTRNFAQPFDFLPERWLDNPHGDKLDAVQPFSIGPRNCIGRKSVLPPPPSCLDSIERGELTKSAVWHSQRCGSFSRAWSSTLT
jgi:cytochrome P450